MKKEVIEEQPKLEVTDDIKIVDKTEKNVYLPYNTREERMDAIAEINMLTGMVNASYFYLHFSNSVMKGNKVIEEGKITKSTQISLFGDQQINSFAQRISEINNRLVAESKV